MIVQHAVAMMSASYEILTDGVVMPYVDATTCLWLSALRVCRGQDYRKVDDD